MAVEVRIGVILDPGTTLAHFRITAELGEGGMGKVYRAEDLQLGREVALKVLPDAVAQDPERLARFEREARVLATLSHPRIAAVHEFGQADGVHFLVMELAGGETLADRIARGALPVSDALPIALQIAEALEAAHERGIVHRDLKPANVKVDGEGNVKVLDFGLAKALERDPASGSGVELTHSPTLTGHATMGGVLLGTAAYMSPEQAAGRPADRRSDVWAFGVVLLELLGGRQVFTGESVSHVLAAVLKDEPAWGSLAPALPAKLADLLQRCLRKDPKRRLQAIGDARVALEEWLADPAVLAAPQPGAIAPPSRRQLVPWPLAAGLAAALAGGLAWWAREPAAPEPRIVRIPIDLPAEQAIPLGLGTSVAISRDGRRQVLTIEEQDTVRLMVREVDRLESRILPGTEGASSPFFSPDGEWIAFFAGGELKKVSLAGGPPLTLATLAADNDRGATWSEDGTIFLTPGPQGSLQRVSEQGGALAPATELDPERSERTHRWPHALPGGRAVLFTSDTVGSSDYYDDARIEALIVATGQRKVVLEGSSRAAYLEAGYLVFARGGTLFAARFDPGALAVEGTPVPVLQQVATNMSTGAAHFAVSGVGSLAYVPGDPMAGLRKPLWADRQGSGAPAEVETALYSQVRLAPDDRRAAFAVGGSQSTDLWIADFERGTASRLTFGGFAGNPTWTPDGRRVAYGLLDATGLRANRDIYWRAADGSGEAELLWQLPEGDAWPQSFSPDGRLLVVSVAASNQSDLWILPVDGDRTPRPLLQAPFSEGQAELSRDGRWLAYTSNESGRQEVFVQPFPGPGGKWQISNGGGTEPHWSGDGRELFYRDAGALMRVPVDTTQGFVAGRPERLFEGVGSSSAAGQYAVTRDGERFLYLPTSGAARLSRAVLVLDWASEVERLTAPRK